MGIEVAAHHQLVVALGQLLLGLRSIGLDDPTAWDTLAKTGLDSMPALRRDALDLTVS